MPDIFGDMNQIAWIFRYQDWLLQAECNRNAIARSLSRKGIAYRRILTTSEPDIQANELRMLWYQVIVLVNDSLSWKYGKYARPTTANWTRLMICLNAELKENSWYYLRSDVERMQSRYMHIKITPKHTHTLTHIFVEVVIVIWQLDGENYNLS